MPLPFLASLAISLVMQVVAYAIMPRAKQERSPAVRELEEPKPSAGTEVSVIFGTVLIKDPNIIWYGDRSKRTTKVKV